jgi:hypothetical protein
LDNPVGREKPGVLADLMAARVTTRIGDNQKVEFARSFVGKWKLAESGNYRNLKTGKKGGAFVGIVYGD